MTRTADRFTCFVCGYRTLPERCDWDICPVCYWEDDVFVKDNEDRTSPANGMAVSEAQANFILIGAAKARLVANVRPPERNEERDPEWKPLSKALEIVEQRR